MTEFNRRKSLDSNEVRAPMIERQWNAGAERLVGSDLWKLEEGKKKIKKPKMKHFHNVCC